MEHKRVLIDTSILIDHLRKKRKSDTTFIKLTEHHDCLISSITEFEFAVGSTPTNRDFVKILLSSIIVLPFDSVCVETAVDIFLSLKAKNKLISLPDIFIVATAVAHDLPLQTLNLKHFERIDRLKLNLI